MGKDKRSLNEKREYISDTNIQLLNIPSISSLHNEKKAKIKKQKE